MYNIQNIRLLPAAVVFISIIAAYLLGNGVAEENYSLIGLVIGALALIPILSLGRKVYVLIPICWGLTGQISILPLPFTVRQLIIIIASGVFIHTLIIKKDWKIKKKFEIIDILAWINIIYVLVVFINNPVGINALGGERVGGKPYVDVALGFMSYLFLRRESISAELSKRIPFWVVFFSIITACIGATGYFFPGIGDRLALMYSKFSSTGTIGLVAVDISDFSSGIRWEFMQELGLTLTLYSVSLCNPTRFINVSNIKYLLIYLIGIIAILTSGFRSAMIYAMFTTTISSVISDRFLGGVKAVAVIICVALGAITTFIYFPFEMPMTFQRTLCFLPGNWNQEAIKSAEDSTNWRTEIWVTSLTSDKYIHNRLFGDGFAYLRTDYERAMDVNLGRINLSNTEAQQEMFILAGDFHSGPVGSVKFVGFIGLMLFLIFQFSAFRKAVSLIRLARNTDYQLYAFFYCIPVIVMPLYFVFVVGDYRQDLVMTFFYLGMMHILKNSIEVSKKS